MLYGKGHKVLPKLERLYFCLQEIIARTDDANMLNYATHMKEIKLTTQVCLGEIDRIAMEDAK
jgi:hypothetical protein